MFIALSHVLPALPSSTRHSTLHYRHSAFLSLYMSSTQKLEKAKKSVSVRMFQRAQQCAVVLRLSRYKDDICRLQLQWYCGRWRLQCCQCSLRQEAPFLRPPRWYIHREGDLARWPNHICRLDVRSVFFICCCGYWQFYCLLNELNCVGWGVKLYSLTHWLLDRWREDLLIQSWSETLNWFNFWPQKRVGKLMLRLSLCAILCQCQLLIY